MVCGWGATTRREEPGELGCIWRCDPKSGKCVFARQQLKWVRRYIDADIILEMWPGSSFVYNHKGMLQWLEWGSNEVGFISPVLPCYTHNRGICWD